MGHTFWDNTNSLREGYNVMTKELPENWTDKEFLEDAVFLTPHERIEQEEYDSLKLDPSKPITIREIK